MAKGLGSGGTSIFQPEIMTSFLLIGPDDHSPIHKHGYEANYAGYDERCSCCWLGFAHSEKYHEQALIGATLKVKKHSQSLTA